MKKFPLFIQHDSMQCGIACLCMICKFFGRSISIETMANLCHANKEGVSLMGLSESATILGFHAIAARTSINKLQIVPLPCILHWNQWLSTNTNGEDKGIAMFLETTPAFFAYKMQKEENIKEKRSFRFLLGYVKKYRKYFGQIVLGLVVGSLYS